MKVRLQHPGGWFVDRIPAWITWATVAPGQMGAKFDGIYWNPPDSERHRWCVPRCTLLGKPLAEHHNKTLLDSRNGSVSCNALEFKQLFDSCYRFIQSYGRSLPLQSLADR